MIKVSISDVDKGDFLARFPGEPLPAVDLVAGTHNQPWKLEVVMFQQKLVLAEGDTLDELVERVDQWYEGVIGYRPMAEDGVGLEALLDLAVSVAIQDGMKCMQNGCQP